MTTPGKNQRVGWATSGWQTTAAWSHCKVEGAGLVQEGSANLHTDGNREQLGLCHDRGSDDFHEQRIDVLGTRHEGDEG
jgi:hypothetical protein